MDATESDDASLVGDVAHIVAEKADGPRGNSSLTLGQRNRFANLLLLCKIHHKLVDDQPATYTVSKLHEIKAAHEAWVRRSLTIYDESLQRDKEVYASLVELWEERCKLSEWEEWTSGLLAMGQPSLMAFDDSRLAEVRQWLFARVWPMRFGDLEGAFLNFRVILGDLHETFRTHSEERGDVVWTRKFYRIDDWNPELYHRLLAQFEYHVDLVQDLTLELTRAANLVCDMVRRRIDPSYRMDAGVVTVVRGPDLSLKSSRLRPEYQMGERTERPYANLHWFLDSRVSRDICIGHGLPPE